MTETFIGDKNDLSLFEENFKNDLEVLHYFKGLKGSVLDGHMKGLKSDLKSLEKATKLTSKQKHATSCLQNFKKFIEAYSSRKGSIPIVNLINARAKITRKNVTIFHFIIDCTSRIKRTRKRWGGTRKMQTSELTPLAEVSASVKMYNQYLHGTNPEIAIPTGYAALTETLKYFYSKWDEMLIYRALSILDKDWHSQRHYEIHALMFVPIREKEELLKFRRVFRNLFDEDVTNQIVSYIYDLNSLLEQGAGSNEEWFLKRCISKNCSRIAISGLDPKTIRGSTLLHCEDHSSSSSSKNNKGEGCQKMMKRPRCGIDHLIAKLSIQIGEPSRDNLIESFRLGREIIQTEMDELQKEKNYERGIKAHAVRVKQTDDIWFNIKTLTQYSHPNNTESFPPYLISPP